MLKNRKFDKLYNKIISEMKYNNPRYTFHPQESPPDNPYEHIEDQMSPDGQEFSTTKQAPYNLNGQEVYLNIGVYVTVYPYPQCQKEDPEAQPYFVTVFSSKEAFKNRWKTHDKGRSVPELINDPGILQLVKQLFTPEDGNDLREEYLQYMLKSEEDARMERYDDNDY